MLLERQATVSLVMLSRFTHNQNHVELVTHI